MGKINRLYPAEMLKQKKYIEAYKQVVKPYPKHKLSHIFFHIFSFHFILALMSNKEKKHSLCYFIIQSLSHL